LAPAEAASDIVANTALRTSGTPKSRNPMKSLYQFGQCRLCLKQSGVFGSLSMIGRHCLPFGSGLVQCSLGAGCRPHRWCNCPTVLCVAACPGAQCLSSIAGVRLTLARSGFDALQHSPYYAFVIFWG
jgi:hypothetical protein